jgi:hypothetical protein
VTVFDFTKPTHSELCCDQRIVFIYWIDQCVLIQSIYYIVIYLIIVKLINGLRNSTDLTFMVRETRERGKEECACPDKCLRDREGADHV